MEYKVGGNIDLRTLCNKSLRVGNRGKIYFKKVVKPDSLFGAKTWMSKKSQEEKMNENAVMVLCVDKGDQDKKREN